MSDKDLFHAVMGMIRGNKYDTANEMVHAIIDTVWQSARAQQSAEGRRVHEPFGTESAYQEAKGRLMGSNMNISCALVSELVEGFRLLNSSPADKPEGEWLPLEPTEKMLEAAMSKRDRQYPANAKRYLRYVWRAMYFAAMSPSAPDMGGEK